MQVVLEAGLDADTRDIAVIGSGYWGKNLVRTFHNLGCLRAVCDVSQQALFEVISKYNVQTTQNIDEIFQDESIDAVVVAAPAAHHYAIVKDALRAGKHVFVEKPLALRCFEGKELVDLAHSSNRVLMVGHILEYHPAIQEIKRLIEAG